MEKRNANTAPPISSRGCVLVLAPKGQDASLAANALESAGIPTKVCAQLLEIAQDFDDETNAFVIAEEALLPAQLPSFLQRLETQPPWSDIPVIILTAPGAGDRTSVRALEIFGPTSNVSLLERPLRAVTLAAAVKAASRARNRQRQVRDLIVEREAVLARITRAREEAEEANRAKDHFLAMLSHELRTPLAPVLMTITALQTDSSLSDEMQTDLETLRRNVELEALLIDDLLDLTRISHGKLQLHTDVVDVHAAIERALAISASEFEDKGISVLKDLTAALHRSFADPARLEQVFWNIIKNAVKFTSPGGELRISTRNRGELEDIVIEFTDTGVGIEPDLLPCVFDAFEQGSRTVTNRYGGLGLGLAICKRVIDMHGGEISAQSEGLNRGATFTVVLKAIATSLPEKPARPVPPATATEPADILLVEDHIDTAHIMRRMLQRSGYRVVHAPDIARAKKLASEQRFDLIISDLGLPDGNGIDLMKQLRSSHAIEGIALSGFGMEADVAAAKQAGFIEHLTKPVEWDRLQNAVERLLARRRALAPVTSG